MTAAGQLLQGFTVMRHKTGGCMGEKKHVGDRKDVLRVLNCTHQLREALKNTQ